MTEQVAIASLIDCNRRLIRLLTLVDYNRNPGDMMISDIIKEACDKLDAAEKALTRPAERVWRVQ